MLIVLTHLFDNGLLSLARIKVAVLALRSVRPCITSWVICEILLYLPCDVRNPRLIGLVETLAGTHGSFAWISEADPMWNQVAIN